MPTEPRATYLLAAALGGLAGIRSLLAPTIASNTLARHPDRRHGALVSVLSGPRTAQTLTGLMISELLIDKLPRLPDRTMPSLLAVRASGGATAGAAVCAHRGHNAGVGAAIGALAAVAAAFAGLYLRQAAAKRAHVPQQLPGLIEDAAALTLAAIAAQTAFAPPVRHEQETGGAALAAR